jgi:hypothetical protein
MIATITLTSCSEDGIHSNSDFIAPYSTETVNLVPTKAATGKFGYTNPTTGEQIIAAQFDIACNFSQGLASVCIDGKCGYINKHGEVIVALQYSTASDFCNGYAQVSTNGQRYCIDCNGNVVKPEYSSYCNDHHNGNHICEGFCDNHENLNHNQGHHNGGSHNGNGGHHGGGRN